MNITKRQIENSHCEICKKSLKNGEGYSVNDIGKSYILCDQCHAGDKQYNTSHKPDDSIMIAFTKEMKLVIELLKEKAQIYHVLH